MYSDNVLEIIAKSISSTNLDQYRVTSTQDVSMNDGKFLVIIDWIQI